MNLIYPDAGLKKFAHLKGVELGEMTLLHEDNVHFNLIIDQKSDLAVLGSLSCRFNVGPIYKTNHVADSKYESIEKENDEKKVETVAELKKQLKKCENEKKAFKDQYLKCETELRRKTEEAEKLKIEVKDLEQLNALNDQLKDIEKTTSKKSSNEEETITDNDTHDLNRYDSAWKSGLKKRIHKNNAKNSSANAERVFEIEYNCKKCDFQGTSDLQLNKHINLKHAMQTDKT